MRTKRKWNASTGRRYDKGSYDYKYEHTPNRIRARRMRHRARYLMEKKGLVKPNDGKDVDHKIPIGKGGGNNSRRNLRVMNASKNRARK